MDIQKNIKEKTGVWLPISGGDGQSQDNPVIIGSLAKLMIIDIENDYISCWLDDGMWKKTQQSLVFDGDRKLDKIEIWHISENHEESEHVFWFDITECFGSKV